MYIFSNSRICSLFLILSWLRFLPQDSLYLLLHEGPGHRRSLQRTSLTAGTESLTALLDDGVPAAGEAELVSYIAGTLYEVSVLQLAPAVGTLQQGTSPYFITAVT